MLTLPRIIADYVESLLFLYPTAEAAQGNHDAGGSGFLLGIEHKKQPTLAHLYVITNKHVISDSKIVRFAGPGGAPEIVDLSNSRWVESDEDDVAVCSLDRIASFSNTSMVRTSSLLREEELEDETATYRSDHPRYGDDAFMASRLASERLRDGSIPAVRFGTLTSSRPVAVRTDLGFYQDSFLVEMRSISGHSGSPVFLYYNDATLHMQQGLRQAHPSSSVRLLGIDWGHLLDTSKSGSADTGAWNAGIACVVPAWKIAELLADVALARERRRTEQEERPG